MCFRYYNIKKISLYLTISIMTDPAKLNKWKASELGLESTRQQQENTSYINLIIVLTKKIFLIKQ